MWSWLSMIMTTTDWLWLSMIVTTSNWFWLSMIVTTTEWLWQCIVVTLNDCECLRLWLQVIDCDYQRLWLKFIDCDCQWSWWQLTACSTATPVAMIRSWLPYHSGANGTHIQPGLSGVTHDVCSQDKCTTWCMFRWQVYDMKYVRTINVGQSVVASFSVASVKITLEGHQATNMPPFSPATAGKPFLLFFMTV